MKKILLISSVVLNLVLIVIVIGAFNKLRYRENAPENVKLELNQTKGQIEKIIAENKQLADKISNYDEKLASLRTQMFAVQKQSSETEKRAILSGPAQKTTAKTVYAYTQSKFGDYQKAFKEKIVTEYDKDDKPLLETYCDQNGTVTGRQVYKYNQDYTGTKSIYKADGTLEERYSYKYDKQWNITESQCYYTDGSIKEKWIYQYDQITGKITESYCYKKEGSSFFTRTFSYKHEGNKTEITEYDPDKTLVSTVTEEKDNNGNLIERATYWGDKTLANKSIWKYVKDEENHKREVTEYRMEQKFGVPEKVPVSLTVYENWSDSHKTKSTGSD